MTRYFADVPNMLVTLTSALENLFVPLLLIESLCLVRSRGFTRSRLKEMLVNSSSLLIVVPAGALGVYAWLRLFDLVADLVPWQIPTTWAGAILLVVLVDLAYYLEHRFEHTHRLPWDLYHAVHHSSPQFDQTTGFRLSGFDALLTIGYLFPLVVLGFQPEIVLLAYGLVVGYQTWIHTEVIELMPRWFEFVFNTPSHHRVHHGSQLQYLDANYGGILILWDRLFGTFVAEEERPVYGLTTQIESSNPIDVQFSEIRKLWRDLGNDRTWGNRLRRLWQRPGAVVGSPVAAGSFMASEAVR